MNWFEKIRSQIKVTRRGNTVEVDLGEVPMREPAVLIFPVGTFIRIEGEEAHTTEGQEFLAKEWCSGLDMTWGTLSQKGDPYFKALNYPVETRELKILPPAKAE